MYKYIYIYYIFYIYTQICVCIYIYTHRFVYIYIHVHIFGSWDTCNTFARNLEGLSEWLCQRLVVEVGPQGLWDVME